MTATQFKPDDFRGVDPNDAFAKAARSQSPVVVKLGKVAWPDGLAPAQADLGGYARGEKITGALTADVDVLILLYTQLETSALLDVFTGDNEWSPARAKTWYPYAHNFDALRGSVQGIDDDDFLKDGVFGNLYAMQVGKRTVAFFKNELHPKANGPKLPFVTLIKQLVGELQPKLVVSTGTAGGIGSHINCGDVAICDAARFHVRGTYPTFPAIDTLSKSGRELKSKAGTAGTYVTYAMEKLTPLAQPGLKKCHSELQSNSGFDFVKNTSASKIYTNKSSVSPQPMAVVSADYLTVDDTSDAEGLQELGIMNETDDAFAFYAIGQLPEAQRPQWLSVRNASEPQIAHAPFPKDTPPTQIVDALKAKAGTIYGIYQYCTTINSAFACWAVSADL
ncbi:MAG TPA: hypothetical protein VMG98_10800 [Verrucomicrobiae bacterium]|nr:hypothetical protein [Verrucomicrobiae bacterium]